MPSTTDDKNVPIVHLENVHNDELAHHLKPRNYITKKQIKEIAEKKFQCNGQGITFEDIMDYFTIKKRKAQRTLKHFRMKKVSIYCRRPYKTEYPFKRS